MKKKFYSKENLHFLMYDVHHTEALFEYDYFSAHDQSSVDLFLDATEDVSATHLLPIFTEMDRNEPQLVDGRIRVHPKMKEILGIMGEGGWISSSASESVGGSQLPVTVMMMSSFIMGCANYSVTAFPYLTMGAAHLIESFASEKQKQNYLPKMFSGAWQGTMALTEPGAGSSLSDLATTATPTNDEYYLIKGHKIFISCGDHDAVENVVHLMLARIEGAPLGTKGISMFIVPRARINEDDTLVANDVLTGGVFHKMGYKGAPIAHLIMGEKGDCRGYLVGEANKGLSYMFQMMNEARISVGLHATSISTAAYYAALQYTRERSQGRPITEKNPENPQVPIINHADVRRMLLFQKSFIEASLSLQIQCCIYEDLKRVTVGAEQEKNYYLLEILTPIAKSYPAETSILSTSQAVQCLGGYGYTTDFTVEQYFRETRIHAIHEGTTAIHGMDLLGRKIMLGGGKAVQYLMQEVMGEIEEAKKYESLKESSISLEKKVGQINEVTMHLMGIAQTEGPGVFLSDATLYLELFGLMVIGWQWLKIGNIAAKKSVERPEDVFYLGKIATLKYFFEYELPKTEGLMVRLKSKTKVTTTLNEDYLD